MRLFPVFIACLIIPIFEVNCQSPKSPMVKLDRQGTLEGISLISRQGREYFGFLGVPFGKIPQRFAVPEPGDKWDGVKAVQTLPPPCFHFNVFIQDFAGTENDCLVLNVYSKTLDVNAKLPVIVFNTPGGYQFGGASMYEAKYIMDEEIVFISINNRLGALGFLNTGDGVVSGNMGMKDQVLALKWVQQHVHKFGGDPNLVTFAGESASASAVHFHMLSPMSKGLFHRGISNSGSALNPWALQPNPKTLAKRLAELVDCPASSSEEMVKCFRQKNASEIGKAQLKLVDLSPEFNIISAQFVPSIESPRAKGPRFLTDTPYNLITRGEIANKVPWISGFTENEGSFLVALPMAIPASVEKLNKDWNKMAPKMWYYDVTCPPDQLDIVSAKVRNFYFGNKAISSETKRNFSNIFTDRFIANGVVKGMTLHAKHQPVYPYILNYNGKYSGIQFVFGEAVKERDGFAHTDELQYLFNRAFGLPEVELGTDDGTFSVNLLKLWASFAKYGKPMATWGPQTEWKPINPKENVIQFYELGLKTGLIADPFAKRRELWAELPLREDALWLAEGRQGQLLVRANEPSGPREMVNQLIQKFVIFVQNLLKIQLGGIQHILDVIDKATG